MKIHRHDILLLYSNKRPERHFVGFLESCWYCCPRSVSAVRGWSDECDCGGLVVGVKYYDPKRGIIADSTWTKDSIEIVKDISTLPTHLQGHLKEIAKARL